MGAIIARCVSGASHHALECARADGGAGNEIMSLAPGAAHGSAFQEAVIKGVAYSSAPTGLFAFALVLWGLRIADAQSMSG